jgi:hypothetical protein
MSILDSAMIGKTMVEKVLSKRKNVEIKYNAFPEKYYIDHETKYVRAMHMNDDSTLQFDFLVLCNGPDAAFHIWDHFGCVLPLLHGQGYAFDMINKDLS